LQTSRVGAVATKTDECDDASVDAIQPENARVRIKSVAVGTRRYEDASGTRGARQAHAITACDQQCGANSWSGTYRLEQVEPASSESSPDERRQDGLGMQRAGAESVGKTGEHAFDSPFQMGRRGSDVRGAQVWGDHGGGYRGRPSNFPDDSIRIPEKMVQLNQQAPQGNVSVEFNCTRESLEDGMSSQRRGGDVLDSR